MLCLQILRRTLMLFSVVLLAFAGLSSAQETVGPITFGEPEFPDGTPVQGLTVTTLNGAALPAPLSFDFPNLDATIAGGPDSQLYVDPPGIEGPSEDTLTIDFGTPVDSAEFGFAVSCPPVVVDALTVNLFDSGGAMVGTQTIDGIDTGFGFAENLITLQGVVFQSLEATWVDCGGGGAAGDWGQDSGEGKGGFSRFFLDNLTYVTASPVPTMGLVGFLMLATALVGTSIWLLRRRQALA